MNNPFKKFYTEKKWFFFSCIFFSFLISAVVKKVKPKEDVLNFFLYYVVSAIVFSLLYMWIEKHFKKRLKNKAG
jgi:hypothetical protein